MDSRERNGRGTPENLIFQGAKTGLGSPQNPLDFSFRFFFSHRLIPTSLRPGRLYLNVLLDFVGRVFAPPIVVEKIPFFLAFLVMVSMMAALSVSGGSESVLALAVIAVAVLALHLAVAVLLACKERGTIVKNHMATGSGFTQCSIQAGVHRDKFINRLDRLLYARCGQPSLFKETGKALFLF